MMPLNRRLGAVALCFAACGCASEEIDAGAPSGEAQRPDVLLITVARLSPAVFEPALRGDVETPALDVLLAGGTVFPRALAPSAPGDANLASVFTGLHPRHHGALFCFYGLDEEHATLAEQLAGAGYRTGGFSVVSLDEQPGLGQGFEVLAAPTAAEIDTWVETWPNARVFEDALPWMRAAEQDGEPWFCWLHVNKARPRGALSAAQRRILPAAVAGSPELARCLEGSTLTLDLTLELEPWLDRLALVGLDESLLPLASFVGQRRARTGARPLVMLLTSPAGGPDPLSPSSLPQPELALRVPLVLAGAQGAAGGRDERPASLLDVLPTLLAQAGVVPARADGIDLLDAAADDGRVRLFVHDRYELGGDTDTLVRLGQRALWVEGFRESTRDTDLWSEPLPAAESAELRRAYEAWARELPDPDSLRRPELEAEWQRAVEEKMKAIDADLRLQAEAHEGR